MNPQKGTIHFRYFFFLVIFLNHIIDEVSGLAEIPLDLEYPLTFKMTL